MKTFPVTFFSGNKGDILIHTVEAWEHPVLPRVGDELLFNSIYVVKQVSWGMDVSKNGGVDQVLIIMENVGR